MQPRPASKRLREQWREVSVHQGAAVRHRQVQNLFSLWVTPGPWCGMCTLEEEFTGGGEKGFYLTIYRRSFRNIKYLSAK